MNLAEMLISVTLAKNSDFIYLRASGSGTGKLRIDNKFLEFAKECRRLGIPCGAYHFAKPSKDLDSAVIQADQFIDVLQQGFGRWGLWRSISSIRCGNSYR